MLSPKEIKLPCNFDPKSNCKAWGYVFVVNVDNPKLQKKIDARARLKVKEKLNQEHIAGQHEEW